MQGYEWQKRDIGQIISSHGDIPHYYGDYVRRFFMAAALSMLLTLPFFPDMLPWAGSTWTLVFVIVLVFCAGLTSPRRKFVMFLNAVIALFGVLIFEYAAILRFASDPVMLTLFQQAEAVIFAYALYYIGKSIRGVRMYSENL